MNTTGAAMTCSVALMRTTIWHELRAPACRGRSAQEKLSMTGKSNDPKEHSREGLHLAECGGGIACGCQRQVSKPAPLPRTTEVVRLPFRDADGEIVAAHVVARKRTAMKDRSWPTVLLRPSACKRSSSSHLRPTAFEQRGEHARSARSCSSPMPAFGEVMDVLENP
jgi:hypothetical protein